MHLSASGFHQTVEMAQGKQKFKAQRVGAKKHIQKPKGLKKGGKHLVLLKRRCSSERKSAKQRLLISSVISECIC